MDAQHLSLLDSWLEQKTTLLAKAGIYTQSKKEKSLIKPSSYHFSRELYVTDWLICFPYVLMAVLVLLLMLHSLNLISTVCGQLSHIISSLPPSSQNRSVSWKERRIISDDSVSVCSSGGLITKWSWLRKRARVVAWVGELVWYIVHQGQCWWSSHFLPPVSLFLTPSPQLPHTHTQSSIGSAVH